jgi:predicted nucleic acid-binding protein
MTRWLADTSVAVPLVQASHAAHVAALEHLGRRKIGLTAHAALETYSVLTRLPGDARLRPADAATVLRVRFPRIATLEPTKQAALVDELAAAGVAGGAVYDAIIAVTAVEDGATLLTRDRRAAATYIALHATIELVRI